MSKTIAWTNEAKANLRAIDQPTALRILHALARLLEFRLRVGDYRVRYNDLGDTLQILAVKHRSEVYR